MSLNASDRKSVRAAQKAAKLAQQQDDEVLAWIMGNSRGRAWVYNLLLRCHIGVNPFAADALVMAHQCGELNVGLPIWADLMRVCPDQYVEMMREANGRDSPAADSASADDAAGGTYNYAGDEPDFFGPES